MKKLKFSMLELLVVVLVILTILSLLLPSVNNIYRNANTLLCQKNLKDLHTIIGSYAQDHNGVLPGISEFDMPEFKYKDFYENYMNYKYWSGHLIPYIDPNFLDQDFERSYKFHKSGEWLTNGGNPATNTTSGKNTIDTMLTNRGLFQSFLCPEVMSSVYDPGIYQESDNKSMMPKLFNLTGISSMGGGAFYGLNYSLNKGLPVAYTANDYLFHGSRSSSVTKKTSEVKNYGKKIMLMEGGNNLGYFVQEPYIHASGTDIYVSMVGFNLIHHEQFSHKEMHFNFVHDEPTEFWYSSKSSGFPAGGGRFEKEKLNQYNDYYSPKAFITPEGGGSGFQTHHISIGSLLVSGFTYVTLDDPTNTSVHPALSGFKDIFGWDWPLSFNYMSGDDIRVSPAVGDSNVLFADGTVKTKHVSWIFTNRIELFTEY